MVYMGRDKVTPSTATGDLSLVHDYLSQSGGAERVVLALSDEFPDAPIYTSVFEPAGTYPAFSGREVRTSPLNRVGPARRDPRLAFPALAPAFSTMHVPGALVLCSSSGWAHGARTVGRKVVYCHSPAKWLHSPDRYFAGEWPASRYLNRALRRPLLRWDASAARSADHYLVNSSMVRGWVQDVYGRDAEVVPPSRGLEPDGPREPVPGVEPGFLLCVSRLVAYKNVEAVVHAVTGMPDQRLVVVGTGPLQSELRRAGTPNVTYVGRLDDARLRWLYAHCSAVVSAALEDFGLTPPEAGGFGKPVAVLRWGGFLDTVDEGVNGVFFDEPTTPLIRRALEELARTSWDKAVIRARAETYSPASFGARMRGVVEEQMGLAR